MKQLIILDNMTDSLMTEELLRSQEVAGRLIPTPPWVSKGCGLAYLAEEEDIEKIEGILRGARINFKILPYMKK